jgi:tetratricopeptide (TPR) repeat protein
MRLQRGYDEVSIGADYNSEINKLKSEDAPQAQIDSVTALRNDAYKQVIEDFGKVTELDSDNYDAWYFLGLCHYFLEEYEEARDAWEKAAEVSPEKAEVWELLAPLYLKLKQPEKSREAQKKAEELKAAQESGQ